MSVVDRLAAPPASRMAGVAWASAAAVGFALATFGVTLFATPGDSQETLVFISNITGVLGVLAFVALLRATHAAIGRVAVPAWLLALAYALLLVRGLVLVPYFVDVTGASLPAVLVTAIPVAFFVLAGAAAGCAGVTWLPDTPLARTPLRITVVGVVIGLGVALTLLTGTGLVLIVTSLGLALFVAFRKPAPPVDDDDD